MANKKSTESNGASQASEPTTPFNDKELAHFKAIILEKRHSAIEDLERMHLQLEDSREQAENDSAIASTWPMPAPMRWSVKSSI